MRVGNTGMNRAQAARDRAVRGPSQAPGVDRATEGAVAGALSDGFFAEVERLSARIKEMPEVRADVVAEAKRLINSGELETAEAYDGAAQALLDSVIQDLDA